MATTGDADREIESAIDALHQGSLEAFTADRNALAAELRKGGNRVAADRVKALAKPSVTAWAVNQVWWTNRPAFEAMLEAGARLKNAHLTWSDGGQTDVRAAAEERRQAVRTVVDAAVAELGDPKTVAPDMHYRISGTVEALASGALSGATPGRLSKDLQASGLEGLGALAAAAAAVPPRAGSKSPSARKTATADKAGAPGGSRIRGRVQPLRQADAPRPTDARALVEGARRRRPRPRDAAAWRERQGGGCPTTGAGTREGRGAPDRVGGAPRNADAGGRGAEWGGGPRPHGG